MKISLKIIAIYKKGSTPLVKYQETANLSCARQIFMAFFKILSVISGKMYAERIDAMAEKAGQNYEGITPLFDTCHSHEQNTYFAKRVHSMLSKNQLCSTICCIPL